VQTHVLGTIWAGVPVLTSGDGCVGGATCANAPVVTNKPKIIGANILDLEKLFIPTPAEPR
jgi:hypothetical protein